MGLEIEDRDNKGKAGIKLEKGESLGEVAAAGGLTLEELKNLKYEEGPITKPSGQHGGYYQKFEGSKGGKSVTAIRNNIIDNESKIVRYDVTYDGKRLEGYGESMGMFKALASAYYGRNRYYAIASGETA